MVSYGMSLLGRIGNLVRGLVRSAVRDDRIDPEVERQVDQEVAEARAETRRTEPAPSAAQPHLAPAEAIDEPEAPSRRSEKRM